MVSVWSWIADSARRLLVSTVSGLTSTEVSGSDVDTPGDSSAVDARSSSTGASFSTSGSRMAIPEVGGSTISPC